MKYIATLMAAVLAELAIYQFTTTRQFPPPPAGFVASQKVKLAMKYHGIRSCESDSSGTLWFGRRGKRCRLFTKGACRFVQKFNTEGGK